jgi:hypothetical protein
MVSMLTAADHGPLLHAAAPLASASTNMVPAAIPMDRDGLGISLASTLRRTPCALASLPAALRVERLLGVGGVAHLGRGAAQRLEAPKGTPATCPR